MGWFTFQNVVQESSATPLLDIVGLSNHNATTGAVAHFAQVTVSGYMSADSGVGAELSSRAGIVRFNLSAPGGILDGVTITGAGDTPAAVVVLTGEVKNVVVLQSAMAGVVNGSGVPIGPAVVGTAGGLSLTGMALTCTLGSAGAGAAGRCQRQHRVESAAAGSCTLESSEHPLMVGQSGETHGRLAIEADGSILFGKLLINMPHPRVCPTIASIDAVVHHQLTNVTRGRGCTAGNGSADFHTQLRSVTSVAVRWTPEPGLGPGKAAATVVAVPGVSPGDVATASHDQIGLELVLIGANVAAEGLVQVILRNAGETAVNIASGLLRVSVTKFA